MLAHRLRRWPNIKTTLIQRLVSAGKCRNAGLGISEIRYLLLLAGKMLGRVGIACARRGNTL